MFKLHLFEPAAPVATNTESVAYEIKEYYEKRLLQNVEPNLVHDQFAEKYQIPKGNGHTIEWRKFSSLPKAGMLNEGVTPDGSSVTVTHVTSSLNQYGDFVRLTDRIQVEAIDPMVSNVCKLQGAQAGITLNGVTKDELAGATNLLFPGAVTEKANLTSTSVLDLATIFKAEAILSAANVPTIGDSYVAIVHPYVANDLRTSEAWIDVSKYQNVKAIHKGEIGMIGNVRFVKSSEAKIWNDNTCPSAGSGQFYSVFQTIVLGQGAYATTSLAGAGLEYIVKGLGQGGDDPLNQRSSAGWKAMKAAKRLDETRMVSILTCSTTMPKAKAN